LTTQTATATKAVAVPPLLVPVEAWDGKQARPAEAPLRTQTTRSQTAVVVPPFVTELRGGSSTTRPLTEALATVTASGTHHGLLTPPPPAGTVLDRTGRQAPDAWGAWAALYSYDTGLRSLAEALPTQTTIGGDALLEAAGALPAVGDCWFRMLEPAEIGAAMAFLPGYVVLGNRRQRVRQYGNAVTPPVAELLVSALVEAVTGTDLERAA
jgi:DNA (cytosine-5)-methyltransferase 1